MHPKHERLQVPYLNLHKKLAIKSETSEMTGTIPVDTPKIPDITPETVKLQVLHLRLHLKMSEFIGNADEQQ